jgi:hypothetical protein
MSRQSTIEFRQTFRTQIIPRYYSGTLHVFFNFTVLIALCAYFLSKVSHPTTVELLALPLGFVVGNLGVYLIHKYLLHRQIPGLAKYTFRIHSLWHHRFFTHELSVYESSRDFYILFFPTWVVAGFAIGFLPLTYFVVSLFASTNVTFLFLFMSTFYFILYEVFHFSSHLPEKHWLHKIPVFRIAHKHHLDHHNPALMHDYNFNIVYPLFDFILGTIYKNKNI